MWKRSERVKSLLGKTVAPPAHPVWWSPDRRSGWSGGTYRKDITSSPHYDPTHQPSTSGATLSDCDLGFYGEIQNPHPHSDIHGHDIDHVIYHTTLDTPAFGARRGYAAHYKSLPERDRPGQSDDPRRTSG